MDSSVEIMVVDDTSANLEVISETLSSKGYRVAAAISGERALKRLQTHLPALILLDIQMPGLDGFEVCQQIKVNPVTAHIPIIFITARSDTKSILHGFEVGAVDYISKPFQEAELLARVDTHLQLRHVSQLYDIEREKAEQLAQLNQRLSLTQFSVDHSVDGILWFNPDASIAYANDSMCELLGYTLEDFLQLSIADLKPNSNDSEWNDFLEKGKEQQRLRLETHLHTRDGQNLPVEVALNHLQFSDREYYVAHYRDIRDRIRRETALQLSEARAVAVFSQATVGILEMDTLTGKLLQVNDYFCNLLGYSRSELLGMAILELMHRDDIPACRQLMKTLEAREINDFALEKRYIHKNGSLVWCLISCNTVQMPDRTCNTCIAMLQDISDRKAAEVELHHFNTQLDQRVQERTQELANTLETLQSAQVSLIEAEKMAALGNLVAGVAHEINTPIGTSITVASTLADETEIFLRTAESGQIKRSTLNHYLDVARRCSMLLDSNLGRAGDLIQSFKQVAVDQTHQELRTFNLKDYLQGVVVSLQPQVKRSSHHLSLTGNDSISLTNDPGLFAQVVTNLVTNSLKHAYPNGNSGQLLLQLDLQDDRIVMIYRDDGCGIPVVNLNKVYEPFFTTARHRNGTGLGLNIVYNIVCQSLRGTIDLQSQEGQGTEFTITLPYDDAESRRTKTMPLNTKTAPERLRSPNVSPNRA